ncbi:hypothetical protein GMO_11820 [Gluconobacter morbifer G707]|uniref:Uncharacterized protein n=1 Tax=Gluconobacter morbifer G707 TaxID=1088869 RepID=G6XIY2_9PROT|nr:hypothetical protein GMO_11820 [Gluconobacter morbifer G707]
MPWDDYRRLDQDVFLPEGDRNARYKLVCLLYEENQNVR